MEQIQENSKVGKVTLVAPWFRLTPTATVTEEEKEIARPWLRTSINWEKVKSKAEKFTAIFSDNDYFVPLEFNQNIVREKLNAEIIIGKGKKHFSEEDGVSTLPFLLKLL